MQVACFNTLENVFSVLQILINACLILLVFFLEEARLASVFLKGLKKPGYVLLKMLSKVFYEPFPLKYCPQGYCCRRDADIFFFSFLCRSKTPVLHTCATTCACLPLAVGYLDSHVKQMNVRDKVINGVVFLEGFFKDTNQLTDISEAVQLTIPHFT